MPKERGEIDPADRKASRCRNLPKSQKDKGILSQLSEGGDTAWSNPQTPCWGGYK